MLLDELADVREPESYDLCVGHAERTGPPHGWTLDDRRRDPEEGAAAALGGERTVALLAQMLGRDRDGPDAGDVRPAQAGLFDDDGSDAATLDVPHDTSGDGAHGGPDGGARADAW